MDREIPGSPSLFQALVVKRLAMVEPEAEPGRTRTRTQGYTLSTSARLDNRHAQWCPSCAYTIRTRSQVAPLHKVESGGQDLASLLVRVGVDFVVFLVLLPDGIDDLVNRRARNAESAT